MSNSRADEFFDFSVSYIGHIEYLDNILPIQLYFLGSAIKLRVITEKIKFNYSFNKKIVLKGKALTLQGLKKFVAYNTELVSASEKFNGTSVYEFNINSLIIYSIGTPDPNGKFSKFNLTYSLLHKIGKLQNIENNGKADFPYAINRTFEECIFFENHGSIVKFHNHLIWNLSMGENEIFIANRPYIGVEIGDLTLEEIEIIARETGWFLQLIFGARQDLNGLFLFSNDHKKTDEAYTYYRSEIIGSLLGQKKQFIIPPFEIEDLQKEICIYFTKWRGFQPDQKLFCRLFFNEINSDNLVLDDRFKNLCSLIQGLEIISLKELVTERKTNNKMVRKLFCAIDSHPALIYNKVSESFLTKICELIADQRDFYQHMNKPLKYDLGKTASEINIVNEFLTSIIKVYLIDAIGVTDKLNKILRREHEFIDYELLKLQNSLIAKGKFIL